MQPLTERVWTERFTELRHLVLQEWPDVPREDLEAIRDDYAGLVALLHRRTGRSAEDIRRWLRNVDVDAVEAPEEEAPEDNATVGAALRLGTGFTTDERPRLVERLAKLDRRLRRFPVDGTSLGISVKDRGSTTQSVTLECRLPGFDRLVSTSTEPDLRDAITECRDDLWRQIDDSVTRRQKAARH